MKRILVTGCGGAPTINFVRSLRDADPKRKKYRIVGVDSDKFTIHRHECDRGYLCPSATNKKYLPYLLEIIKREKIDFLHSQPEIEVFVIGKNRRLIEQAGCQLLMPSQKTIEILRDKFKSYQVWAKSGIKVPGTIIINSEKDLKKAFKRFGKDIWIRETIGAAGKGSLSKPSFELARAWIDSRGGWGHTIASAHLTTRTVTWQSLWHQGKLVGGQGRERLSWEAANRTQSGVTGITGTAVITNDSEVAKLAIDCIKAADRRPHGIFSVDFTYDHDGLPNPTEINIGKFFTTHHFLTRAGINMPEIMVQLAFGNYKGRFNIINPCRQKLYWIRGMDTKPVLIDQQMIDETKRQYHAILHNIQSHRPTAKRSKP